MNTITAVWRHIHVWREAWRRERAKPIQATPSEEAVAFLPPVLEIQDAPPSPIGRAILWTIVGFMASAAIWSSVSRVDIVTVAPGQIIPSGHSKVIQPVDSAVIVAIHVEDGQVVKQGELLIELDATQYRADQERATNEYRAAITDAARLRSLIAGQTEMQVPDGIDPVYGALQQQILRDQMAEYQARIEASLQSIEQRKAAIQSTQENIRRLQATVPMEAERSSAYKALLDQQYVSRMDYLQFEQQRVERAQELADQKSKLRLNQAALAEAQRNHRAFISEFQQSKQGELADAETKAASLLQEARKAAQKSELQHLLSPIDGVVQQLAVHTVGGVVTPAQPLLIVVPRDHPIEVEALIENKDIGFVRAGQSVEVKVETFPFTLYGTIAGKVLSVSDDAVRSERSKGTLIYSSRVSVDRSAMSVEGKLVQLSPGMAVTVEVKTGQRRIIEYLLSPLFKTVQESMRER